MVNSLPVSSLGCNLLSTGGVQDGLLLFVVCKSTSPFLIVLSKAMHVIENTFFLPFCSSIPPRRLALPSRHSSVSPSTATSFPETYLSTGSPLANPAGLPNWVSWYFMNSSSDYSSYYYFVYLCSWVMQPINNPHHPPPRYEWKIMENNLETTERKRRRGWEMFLEHGEGREEPNVRDIKCEDSIIIVTYSFSVG